jgi:hypothetical protein
VGSPVPSIDNSFEGAPEDGRPVVLFCRFQK